MSHLYLVKKYYDQGDGCFEQNEKLFKLIQVNMLSTISELDHLSQERQTMFINRVNSASLDLNELDHRTFKALLHVRLEEIKNDLFKISVLNDKLGSMADCLIDHFNLPCKEGNVQ